MIKDILVYIPTERPLRPVIDTSIVLAADLGALAFGYVSAGAAASALDGAAAPAVAAVFEMEHEKDAERAPTALAVWPASPTMAALSPIYRPTPQRRWPPGLMVSRLFSNRSMTSKPMQHCLDRNFPVGGPPFHFTRARPYPLRALGRLAEAPIEIRLSGYFVLRCAYFR
jgi:hypothetical protein